MLKNIKLLGLCLLFPIGFSYAQTTDQVINNIIKEASDNSQLKKLAHELTDGIGPRLVGTPQMKQAHDWAVEKYQGWGNSGKKREMGRMAWLGKRYLAYRHGISACKVAGRNAAGMEPVNQRKNCYR